MKQIVFGVILCGLGIAGFVYSDTMYAEASRVLSFHSISRGRSMISMAVAVKYLSIAIGVLGAGLVIVFGIKEVKANSD